MAVTEEEKVSLLLDTFFPKQPQPELEEMDAGRVRRRQLEVPLIEKLEVEEAIMLAHLDKAAGIDELPVRVWRETWQATGDNITNLYEASLRLGYLLVG